MANLLNIIMWQSHRSGYWVCEIYDRQGFKGIGLGRTKELARQRASAVTKTLIPDSRMPRLCNSSVSTSVGT